MSFTTEEFKRRVEQTKERLTKSINYPSGFYELFEVIEKFRISTRPSASYCLTFTNEDLTKLDIEIFEKELYGNTFKIFQTHNYVEINDKAEIVYKNSEPFTKSASTRQDLHAKSLNNKTLFFISDEGTHVFVNGFDIGENTFFSDSEYKTYIKKKDLSELREVLNDYKLKLRYPAKYVQFFVTLSTLKRLYGDKTYIEHKNLLRNKPENIFQNDLKNYLQDSIRRTFNFNTQVPLDSEERLDINTEDDDGNYYFLEIKWVGTSIHRNDQKEGTSFDFEYIHKHAIKQTLNYIKELHANMKTVKLGWLVVFDARQLKSSFELNIYDNINDELKTNLHLFDVISDLIVDNINPR